MAAPFFWGIAALTGMLLLNALPPLIETFGGKGIPAAVMIQGVGLFLPALISLTLPMAVLVATLYGYTRLAADLEMVAMYANGLSVWRMARPALIGAAVVALVDFMVFDQAMPQSNTRLTSMRISVQQKLPTLALRQQVLNVLPPPVSNVIRADAIDQETGKLRGVTIVDLSQYEARRLIHADSGVMAESANGKDLILTLHSGVIFEFKRDEPGRMQQTIFVHNQVTLRDVQNDLQLGSKSYGHRPTEMTSCELLDGIADENWNYTQQQFNREYLTRRDLRALASLPPLLQPAERARPKAQPHCGAYRRVEAWIRRLVMPTRLAAQTLQDPPVQDPPAKKKVVQTPPPPLDSSAQQPVLPPQQPLSTPAIQQPVVAQPAIPQQQFLVPPGNPQGAGLLSDFNSVISAQISAGFARRTALSYEVEYHQKFVVPLACFGFVLMGMALALKFPGSGIGLVIGGSLVIFLGFYIMLQGTKGIAAAGKLDPMIAMYTPLALFTLVGLFAVHSANREMGSARSGGLFDGIIDLFRRMKG